ncbi:MAG: S-methyl-5'-thioinosine phosphorylase [Gammaproteobacteria bacterium]|nr:S-methyl-5'-thioinosine phosphorylase [Gammaproteobacteria bacterium]
MKRLGIIGGSGLDQMDDLHIVEERAVETPYGRPSSSLLFGEIANREAVFLPRHGKNHSIPPHRINYRANICALQKAGVTDILAFAAVGGISTTSLPGTIVVPDQLIDYTWGRAHTFFDGDSVDNPAIGNGVRHIDFTAPFCPRLREAVIQAAREGNIEIGSRATYAVTQGPRLETAAEIDRLEKDGADVVGMTVMPEAALAREMDIAYVCIALVVNEAAGRGPGGITMQAISECLSAIRADAMQILHHFR